MEEMDEYRDRIERRQSDRRQLKNDRRHYVEPVKPKFWEPIFIIDMVFFAALAVAYYFVNKN